MIILIGPSASGKTSIEKRLVARGLKRIVSYTTRPQRINEPADAYNWIDSNFKFEYARDHGFFAEWSAYDGRLYGIAREDCIADGVAVVETQGFHQLKSDPDLHVISFYLQSDDRDRAIRMLQRGDKVNDVIRRLQLDEKHFAGVAEECDYIIYDVKAPDALDRMTDQIIGILRMRGII